MLSLFIGLMALIILTAILVMRPPSLGELAAPKGFWVRPLRRIEIRLRYTAQWMLIGSLFLLGGRYAIFGVAQVTSLTEIASLSGMDDRLWYDLWSTILEPAMNRNSTVIYLTAVFKDALFVGAAGCWLTANIVGRIRAKKIRELSAATSQKEPHNERNRRI